MFERKSSEWRSEQARVRRELERHEAANQAYPDEGLALAEVANRAAEMYPGRTPEQKRRLLNFVLLNSTWRDGRLDVEYREPFNLLAESIAERKSQKAPASQPEAFVHHGSPSRTVERTWRVEADVPRKDRRKADSNAVEDRPPRPPPGARAAEWPRLLAEGVHKSKADLARAMGVSRA